MLPEFVRPPVSSLYQVKLLGIPQSWVPTNNLRSSQGRKKIVPQSLAILKCLV